VTDVARANVAALTAPDAVDGPLNVASGRPCTVLAMARALAGAIDPTLEPVVTKGYRLGDVRHVVASPQRALDTLGFRAEVPPAEGLAAFATAPLRRAAPG
jgi:dTDP-L-rhamnose 4-epimerase